MSRRRLRDIGEPRLPLEHASHARCLEHIAIGADLRAQSTLLGAASKLRGDEEPAAATGHDASSLANRSWRTFARNAGAFRRLAFRLLLRERIGSGMFVTRTTLTLGAPGRPCAPALSAPEAHSFRPRAVSVPGTGAPHRQAPHCLRSQGRSRALSPERETCRARDRRAREPARPRQLTLPAPWPAHFGRRPSTRSYVCRSVA